MMLGLGGLSLLRRAGAGAAVPLVSQLPQQASLLGMWDMSKYATSPRAAVPNQKDATATRQGLGPPARRNFTNAQFWTPSQATLADSTVTGPDGKTQASTFVSSGTNWFLTMNGVNNQTTWLPAGTYTLGINVRWAGTGTPNFKMGLYSSGLATKTATSSWQRFSTQVTVPAGTTFLMWLYTPDGTSAANFEISDAEIFSGSSDLGPEPIGSHIYFHKLSTGAAAPTLSGGLLDVANASNSGFIQFANSVSFGPFSLLWTARQGAAPFDASFQPVLAQLTPATAWQQFTVSMSHPVYLSGSQLGAPSANLAQIDSLNRGAATFCVTYDGTTVKVYCNGIVLSSVAGSATAKAMLDFYFSKLQSTYYSSYQYNKMALYSSALSAADVRTASSLLSADAVANGVTIGPDRPLFFEGDSITAGLAATAPLFNAYAVKAATTASPTIRAGNLAIAGSSLTSLNSRAAALDALLPASKNGVKYGLHVLVGANDLGSSNGAAFAASLQTYLAARRTAGWDFIVCGTIISRTSQGDGGAQFDIDRAVANPIIRGWVGTTIEACADYAANANVGANGAASSLTYFNADKTHPNDTGHAQMYPITTAAFAGLWGY